jgi:hypothetical protein
MLTGAVGPEVTVDPTNATVPYALAPKPRVGEVAADEGNDVRRARHIAVSADDLERSYRFCIESLLSHAIVGAWVRKKLLKVEQDHPIQ